MKNILTAGILGGIILFAWGFVSWMVIPWHTATMLKFRDETSVGAVITANAPQSGVYLLPSWEHKDKKTLLKKAEAITNRITNDQDMATSNTPNLSKTQKNKVNDNTKKDKNITPLAKTGPLVFASVFLGGMESMIPYMVSSFFIQCIAAALVAFLLSMTSGLPYIKRLSFVVFFALAAAVVTHLPYWNWFHFSPDYTLVAFADLLIGWFLAGLAIAKVVD